jgi:ketosteroid isomerase-like protein
MSKEIISKFYQAFKVLDAETMSACYHPNVIFEDPAFGILKGEHAANMWRMLCQSQQDKGMLIEFNVLTDYTAHWEARYVFSRTGRKVHNRIHADFEFSEGLIIKHTDQFNLHRWAGMALGLQGKLIGWTPYFRKKLQLQTNRLLQKFESNTIS